MTRNKIETVMSYDQWEQEHKRRTKKAIHDTIQGLTRDIATAMLILALPLGMVAHFLLSTGY